MAPTFTPNVRFIQFIRKHGIDKEKRLGVLSEDGNYFIEISGGCCISRDMITFIKQQKTMEEIAEKLEELRPEWLTEAIEILPPVTNPSKIIGVGCNYMDICTQTHALPPQEPTFFSKLPNTLIGHNGDVIKPRITKSLDYEVELAVIIGKEAKHVLRSNALDYVFGYTIAQDITARDWQKEHNGGQFLLGKSMDTFCPLGPAIVHASVIPDPQNLNLKTTVGEKVRQDSNTSNMIFRIDEIISRLTQSITLQPGDIILTGTPPGIGYNNDPPTYLRAGDTLYSEIEGLGTLTNCIVPDQQEEDELSEC